MNNRIAAAGLIALALGAGGFAIYMTRTHSTGPAGGTSRVSPTIPAQSNAVSPPPSAPTAAPAARTATIYTVVPSGGDSNRLTPRSVPLTDTGAPARSALVALIAAPDSPLPSGTRLLDVRINDKVATVNFSPEFQKNFHGGDQEEAQTVNAILMTMGQFDTIDQVQILVGGTPIDSLGGHFELSGPVDVVRPQDTRQASNVGG